MNTSPSAPTGADSRWSIMWRGTLPRVALVMGLAQLGYATVLPLLPLYLTERLRAGMLLVGMVVAAFALTDTLGKWALGWASDRLERRSLIVGGALISSLAPLAMTTLRSPEWFIPLQFVDGLGSAALWPAGMALAVETVEPRHQGAAMGVLTLAFFAGLGLGPAVAGYVATATGSYTQGFLVASGLLAAAALLAAVMVPVAPREAPRAGPAPAGAVVPPFRLGASRPSLGVVRDLPILRPLLGVIFLQMFGVGLIMPVAIVYARQVLGFTLAEMGRAFLGVALTIGVAAAITGKIADRRARVPLISWGFLVATLGMWLLVLSAVASARGDVLGLSWRGLVLVLAGMMLAVGFTLVRPAWLARLAEVAPADRLGEVFGLSETVQGIGLVVGPLAGGFLWDLRGPVLPFLVCAVVLTLGTT
ncbi:MAG: MFS transporter, partial [Armatimonadetes bacterium]|nr:MFS transporter [Armatimonadota bacterium]